MYSRLIYLFGAVLIALWGQAVGASTVTLNPQVPTVAPNGSFSIDLFLDASTDDVDGPHPGIFSGAVKIDYDPNMLIFDTSSTTLMEQGRGVSGDRETITFVFEDFSFGANPDRGLVGTFTFQARAELNSATVGIMDGDPLRSFSNDAMPGPNEFFPTFTGASVQVIPLPAAAWLFLSGLGALGLFGRKSHAAKRSA